MTIHRRLPHHHLLLHHRVLAQAVIAAWLACITPLATWAAESAANQPLQIWFIRHGESDINVATVPHLVADDGVSYPLTRTGVDQANALAEALATAPITTIYTSPRLRAVQTADALAFRHGLTLSLAPEAVEIEFGLDPDAEDVRQVYADLARKWLVDKDPGARHGEGESFADVQRRFLPFVRELMNRHADDTGVVVVVAHSATLAFMVPVLAANVPADYAIRHPLPNAGIIKTELRDGKLFCTDWTGIGSADFAR
jgi:broad specificity phosphatase PhoE